MSPSSASRNGSPSRRSGPPGANTRARLGRRDEDRLEDLEDVGLLGVERRRRRARAPPRGRRGRRAASSPSGRPPRRARRACRTCRTTPAPTLKTCAASPKETSTGSEVGAVRGVRAAAGRLDEEVQQRRLLARPGDEHVAARRPGPVSSGSATHDASIARDGGVDRVAAVAQHARAGLRGDRVAGGDDARAATSVTRAHDGEGRGGPPPAAGRRLPRLVGDHE